MEPDQATVIIERSNLGVQPGDRVRAVAVIPDIDPANPFSSDNQVHIRHPKAAGNNSGLVTVLLVVGLLGVLLGGGLGNTQDVANNVTAEAVTGQPDQPDYGGLPGVYVSWNTNLYGKSNTENQAWQIYRSDVGPIYPVAVVDGPSRSVIDRVGATYINPYLAYSNLGQAVVGVCNPNFQNAGNPGTAFVFPPTLGTPELYSVQLIFALSSIDVVGGTTGGTATAGTGGTGGLSTGGLSSGGTGLASGGTASTGGTGGTGGLTTGGTGGLTTGSSTATAGTTGTTAGTTGTGGTGSTGVSTCYFATTRTPASGLATPLAPPVALSPGSNTTFGTGPRSFTFTGSARTQAIEAIYVIQFSDSPNFTPNNAHTFTYGPITTFGAGGNTGATVGKFLTIYGRGSVLPAAIQAAPIVYWRIGARNAADKPGPHPDYYTKQRYVFSIASTFSQSAAPSPAIKIKH